MSFPIDRVDDRVLEARWAGDVVVCDIDRTYLYTRFSSLKGMARIPLEWAVDKVDIAGMVRLLQELRRGPRQRSRHTPLYFLSASPPQMRDVIERKMLMDGVEFDGTTFKDWAGVLRSGKLRRMREQLGFKITALFHGRLALPRRARETLIGDDLESDALAYALYADLLSGRLAADRVMGVLRRHGVSRADAWDIAELKRMAGQRDGVRRIYIRMERHREPDAFLDYAPHLVACRGPLQMATSMMAEGLISRDGLVRVARDLIGRGHGEDEVADSLRDSVARGLLPGDRLDGVVEALGRGGIAAAPGAVRRDPRWGDLPARSTWTPAALLD